MAALAGVAASPGLGIGTVMVIAEPCLAYEAVEVTDAEAEKSRLHGAIEAYPDTSSHCRIRYIHSH